MVLPRTMANKDIARTTITTGAVISGRRDSRASA
jgi:hypothetical protein